MTNVMNRGANHNDRESYYFRKPHSAEATEFDTANQSGFLNCSGLPSRTRLQLLALKGTRTANAMIRNGCRARLHPNNENEESP
ncbi:hypothetical protein Terro_0806 [Terriglobus roseus DSM 18391]|uniref:Uncharacterized protein n=1 Tax=Terriglobus roseus (strain DSM 18391 / NRRL B-41598 / KBS 63) TaxID=926566 RepID=I3ZD20_TERRK|nr:hypothetical protein Terro_0806 [Terriglobus roseus DSM 18391]